MPTERFFNLSEEKRQRVLDAAVEELSRVPVNDMSINRIVKNAGIPRGSFYQYFGGKNDLLTFLMRDYGVRMVGGIRESIRESGGDLFIIFKRLLLDTVEFGAKEGRYAFCRNIFSHLQVNEKKVCDFLHIDKQALTDQLMPYLSAKSLKYRDKEDILVLVEILVALLRYAIATVFSDISRADEVIKLFNKQCDMLKQGVASE